MKSFSDRPPTSWVDHSSLAMAVAGLEIRVVILVVGHEADRVDEAQRVVEVVET